MEDSPSKLVIRAFADPDYQSTAGPADTGQVGEYVVHVNPSQYQQTFRVEYAESQPLGGAGKELKFKGTSPEQLSFDFTLDATGAVANSALDLDAEIQKLLDTVYEFNGEIHAPNYLVIEWGKLDFHCKLTSLTISSSLFRPDGTTLRAKVSCQFQQFETAKKIAQEAKMKSPDITREIMVRAGDTLPILTKRAYGNAKYYIQVARHNQLKHFRDLAPGQTIIFPPIAEAEETVAVTADSETT